MPPPDFDALGTLVACPGERCGFITARERLLIEAMGVAVYTTDAEGTLTYYNAAAAELWGWRPPLGEQTWCGAWRLFEPDGTPLPPDRCPMAVCLRENRPVRGVWAYAERPDGTRVPFAPFPSPLHDAAGRLTGAINLLVDISGLRAAEAARAATEARFHAAQEMSPEGFLIAAALRGPDGGVADFRIDYANPAAGRLFARSRQQLEGATLLGLLADEALAGDMLRSYAGVIATGRTLLREAPYVIEGRRRWLRGRTMRLGDGIVVAVEDVTERHETAARMVDLALRDALTGLPNLAAFQDRLARSAEAGEGLGVLLLDLDDFRVANDTLGPEVGNALLRGAGERLRDCLGAEGFVARLEADEFAVLLRGPDLHARAEAAARRIGEALSVPFVVGDYRASIGVTAGIALSRAGEAPEGMLGQARLALAEARAEARGRWRFYAPSMATGHETRALLRAELRDALVAGEVTLHYQPIFDLARNRLRGMEALLRWNHPLRGPVSPAEFIPVAEQTGLVLPLGEWALRRACADAASWPDGVKVAVNLSPVQFHGGEVVRMVRDALRDGGLPPQRLELEITESVLLQQNDAVLAALRELRALGVRIALDDFGTGFASLSYLRLFPFDKIKIDQSFVQDAVHRPDCQAIVRSVAQLAAQLGMVATAEGVEGPGHMAMVRRAGCTEAQGYHLGRPAPIETFGRLLGR